MRRPQLHVVVGLCLGVLIGGAAVGLLGADHEPPPLRGAGTLEEVPDGPVEVVAETVRIPAGFTNRHVHGGPTFNTVRSGLVVITDDGEERGRRYGAGDFFFEPADSPHTIEALEDTRIDVLRLLPEGAPATTTLPDEPD